jgi:hypothetical protein
MTRQDDDHRVGRATLTYLAEPADPALGRLLQVLSPAQVLASIRSGTIPARAARAMDQAQAPARAGSHNCHTCPRALPWHGTRPTVSGWSAPASQADRRS